MKKLFFSVFFFNILANQSNAQSDSVVIGKIRKNTPVKMSSNTNRRIFLDRDQPVELIYVDSQNSERPKLNGIVLFEDSTFGYIEGISRNNSQFWEIPADSNYFSIMAKGPKPPGRGPRIGAPVNPKPKPPKHPIFRITNENLMPIDKDKLEKLLKSDSAKKIL